MQKIIVKESNYSLNDGFAYIVFNDNGIEYQLQACLRELKKCNNDATRYRLVKDNKPIYKKEINKKDSGITDGICGDVNDKAFQKYGEKFCEGFLFCELRKIGIKII